MKVQLKNIMKVYSGKCDGLVYYYDSSLDRMVCRRYVRPRISSQNLRMAAISKNLKALEPSEEYIADLKFKVQSSKFKVRGSVCKVQSLKRLRRVEGYAV